MNNYNRVVFFGLGRKSDGKLSVKIHLNSREKFLKQSVRVPVINKGQEVNSVGTILARVRAKFKREYIRIKGSDDGVLL
jgi:hypothetical protein